MDLDEIGILRAALNASVKLQSHYAKLLNNYDGGERATFADGEAWIARLKETTKDFLVCFGELLENVCANEAKNYVCELCGGTFEKGQPDEDANEEAEEIFGVKAASEDPSMAIVCDDCRKKIQPHGDGIA